MLEKVAELIIFGLMPLAVGILATPDHAAAADKILKGEIVYRERIALPPNAMVSVQLADVSLADAPAAIIGEQQISPEVRFRSNLRSNSIRRSSART